MPEIIGIARRRDAGDSGERERLCGDAGGTRYATICKPVRRDTRNTHTHTQKNEDDKMAAPFKEKKQKRNLSSKSSSSGGGGAAKPEIGDVKNDGVHRVDVARQVSRSTASAAPWSSHL